MSEDLSPEELGQTLDRVVEEMLDAAEVQGPPVDAITLAQQCMGLAVSLGEAASGKKCGRGRRDKENNQIVLRPEASLEQQQWAVAHEIGARLKGELLERLDLAPEQGLGSSGLASLFAQRLLVPTSWFAGDARACGYDLLELKKRFPTASHEVIAWRLLDLSAPCIITVIDNDHVHRRRSNAWRVRRELSAPERQCQQYINRYSRPHQVQEKGWLVQGWPIHRVDWKREILRSVVDWDEGTAAFAAEAEASD